MPTLHSLFGPREEGRLANHITSNWRSMASELGVLPQKVEAKLTGNHTDKDCADQLVSIIVGNGTTMEALAVALKECQFIILAGIIRDGKLPPSELPQPQAQASPATTAPLLVADLSGGARGYIAQNVYRNWRCLMENANISPDLVTSGLHPAATPRDHIDKTFEVFMAQKMTVEHFNGILEISHLGAYAIEPAAIEEARQNKARNGAVRQEIGRTDTTGGGPARIPPTTDATHVQDPKQFEERWYSASVSAFMYGFEYDDDVERALEGIRVDRVLPDAFRLDL